MPTIFYKTFPATAPLLPPETEFDKSFSLASSSSSFSSSVDGMAHASPTSVIGQAVPPSHHKRSDSLQGFVLQKQHQQQPGNVGAASLTSRTLSSNQQSTFHKNTTSSSLSKKRSIDSDSDDDNSRDGRNDYDDDEWVCSVSAKARRTNSCLQDAIRPIASKIQMGFHRIDRKDPISLAVSNLNPINQATNKQKLSQ